MGTTLTVVMATARCAETLWWRKSLGGQVFCHLRHQGLVSTATVYVCVCVCVGGVSPSCLGWSLEQGVRLGKGVACFHGDTCCTEGWVAVGSFKEGGFRGGGSGWGQPKEL